MDHKKQLTQNGYSVIHNVFDKKVVDEMRQTVLNNLEFMSATRPTQTSYHLASFHRFPKFESLHSNITSNELISKVLLDIYSGSQMVALGLTDITINRSQPWHTDLLRGNYAKYLSSTECWSPSIKPCTKVLVYLQDGASLKVIPRSHHQPVDLSDDSSAERNSAVGAECIKMIAGDVILMDIRMVHRGATEMEMQSKLLGDDAKILVSSVFGDRYSDLAQSMQVGNAQRTIDWDVKYGPQSGSL